MATSPPPLIPAGEYVPTRINGSSPMVCRGPTTKLNWLCAARVHPSYGLPGRSSRAHDPVEVWFWKDGRIEIHVLRQERYQAVDRSLLFPDLDVGLLCSFLNRPTAIQAVRAFREALRVG